nr:immunoglobulin light chain junction region [Macaca mulatta]
CLQYNYNPYSF